MKKRSSNLRARKPQNVADVEAAEKGTGDQPEEGPVAGMEEEQDSASQSPDSEKPTEAGDSGHEPDEVPTAGMEEEDPGSKSPAGDPDVRAGHDTPAGDIQKAANSSETTSPSVGNTGVVGEGEVPPEDDTQSTGRRSSEGGR